MNLNSYIGLMGGSYREIAVPGGDHALLRRTATPTSRCPIPTTC